MEGSSSGDGEPFSFHHHDGAYIVHTYVDIHSSNTTTRTLVVILPFSAVSPVVRCLETAPQCTKDDSTNIEDYNHD